MFYHQYMMIIASIGYTTTSDTDVRKIILAGADVIRYNFSYYTVEQNIQHILGVQKIIDDLHADTKQLIDFPINKIRLGDFDIKTFAVRENEEFIFQSGTYTPDCNQFIPVQIQKLGKITKTNQTITLGDGEVAIQITEIINSETIRARILNNGVIKYMKSFNIPHQISPEEVVEKYREIVSALKEVEVNYIAFSYISKEINKEIEEKIDFKKNLPGVKIIIKIENQNGIDDIKEICKNSLYSMIMIDRGEMGVNIPYEEVGLRQTELIEAASKEKKLTILSTQILESAINSYIPNRSEIASLTDAVIKNIHGIMLCQETVYGKRPAYPISIAKKIISTVKKRHTK